MAGARKLENMSDEEREANVAALKPQWAQDYIRQLEGLTRVLHAQLQAAVSTDGGLTQQNMITMAGDSGRPEFPAPGGSPDPDPHVHTPDALGSATADQMRSHMASGHFNGPAGQSLAGWDLDRVHAYHNGLHDGYAARARVPAGTSFPQGEYATVRLIDGSYHMNPIADLPDHGEIRFADFYQVHYGDHETTGGMRLLVVEGDGPVDIKPVSQTTVLICRGGSSS